MQNNASSTFCPGQAPLWWIRIAVWVAIVAVGLVVPVPSRAAEPVKGYWDVEAIQPGMQGVGKTVLKGTELTSFGAEVIGVMKNVAPGRDMVLVRLSGANLEYTGVIAGMSGSPIYARGKLLGAVAYAWSYGKEPIAGVTPFVQMREMSSPSPNALSRRESTLRGLGSLNLAEAAFQPFSELGRRRLNAGGGVLAPLALPVSATGFGPQSLAMLQDAFKPLGMIPVAGGGVTDEVAERVSAQPLVPGAAMGVALATGDFALTGIGTVTHVDGDRVYGWGHPFLQSGAAQYPMLLGFVHTVYPSQSLSMKLGSGVETVGTVDTDVSTCIAGRLGAGPDMLPVTVHVARGVGATEQTYQVQVVREPELVGTLVATVLAAATEGQGEIPDEVTIDFKGCVNVEGREPLVVEDRFSGPVFAGSRGAGALYGTMATVVNSLVRNPFQELKVQSVEARLRVIPERWSAKIEGATLNAERFEPGETVVATAELRPHKGATQRVDVALELPSDLPPGRYTGVVSGYQAKLQRQLRDEAFLLDPRNLDQLFRMFRIQLQERRTNLYLHLTLPETGVALDGVRLPELPGSARAVLESGRRPDRPAVRSSQTAATPTDWVLDGAASVSFQVVRDKNVSR